MSLHKGIVCFCLKPSRTMARLDKHCIYVLFFPQSLGLCLWCARFVPNPMFSTGRARRKYYESYLHMSRQTFPELFFINLSNGMFRPPLLAVVTVARRPGNFLEFSKNSLVKC